MSHEAIVAFALAVIGFVGWLTHMSYRIGVIYTLLRRDLKEHERRLVALERKARPAAS